MASPPPLNIFACVEDHPKSIMLLRVAKRRAQESGGAWTAVFIETPAHDSYSDMAHDRVLRLMTLAEQMGGQALHVEAESIEKGLAGVLEKQLPGKSLVVVGSMESEGRFHSFLPQPWMRAVRMASRYAQVEVVPLSGNHYRRSIGERLYLALMQPRHFAYSLIAVGCAALAAFALKLLLPPALFRINDQNVGLLFMTACAFVAGRFGLAPGLLASIASFLTVNYYFTVPYYTFKLTNITDVLNVALFLFAAMLISLFTSQTRGYAQKAARREMNTQALFTLYRIASETFSREQALEKLHRTLESMLQVKVAFFLPPEPESTQIEAAHPTDLALEPADQKALEVCWAEMKTTGSGSPFNPGTAWRFEPMISGSGEIGVLAVRPQTRGGLDAWFGRLLSAIADQTATVLEHIDLERSIGETRIREEREKLRTMLLSSVSHDFKTPLAGIIGALSVHRSLGERLTAQKRSELIESAIEEAQRLDSFITNILDMTKLESGNITFRKEWHDVDTMLSTVAKRLKHRLRQHELVIEPLPMAAEVHADVMMTEQVLQNVLDNACKYTAAGTRIEVRCSAQGSDFRFEIRDHGNGLPPEKMDRVFDKYARLHKKDSQVAGTGLGLAISKAVMEAQGGWITAQNHPEGGAVFTLSLPQWRHYQPIMTDGDEHVAAKQANRSY